MLSMHISRTQSPTTSDTLCNLAQSTVNQVLQCLWQRTLFPVLERLGFVAGKNDPVCFPTPQMALLFSSGLTTSLMRGRKDCIQDFVANFRKRFKAKDVTWLEDDANIDFVGMIISQTKTTRKHHYATVHREFACETQT